MNRDHKTKEEEPHDEAPVAEDGTELESNDETAKVMDRPFDPTKIKIGTSTPSLDTIIERVRFEEIELDSSAYFQRNPDLWDETQKSRLIESLLIQFPLPAFYFDGTDNDKWLVVDGLQRLSSIRDFVVDDSLTLKNMEFLTKLNGKRYSELSRSLQRVIKSAQVVIYVIQTGTPTEVKFNLFKRINTGGLTLKPQEIRHALFQGRPAEFIATLAQSDSFIKATSGKIRSERMLDRDFANRFLCFYLLGHSTYQPDLDTYMSRAMAKVNTLSERELEAIQTAFDSAMLLANDIFGEEAFRKVYLEDHSRLPPINKALFDAIATQFALLNERQQEELKLQAAIFRKGLKKLLARKEDFFNSVSSSTGEYRKVLNRHETMQKLIQKTISPQDD